MVRNSSAFAHVLTALCLAGAGFLAPGTATNAHAQAIPRITASPENSSLVSLPGEVHPWARAEFDRGRAPDSLSGHLVMVLKRSPEQESALHAFLVSQQDPASPNYHKWITPEEFGKRFGVADSDVQTISGYLASRGMRVGRVYGNHMAIEVGSTAGQIRSTFHTEIHAYSVAGKTYYANNSNPQIPAALHSVVAGIASMNSFHVEGGSGAGTQATYNAATHTLKPLYTIVATNPDTYGLSPADLATIYGIPASTSTQGGLGGKNVIVGIVGDSDINVTYVNNYRSIFGLSANPPVVVIDGNDPGVNGDAYIAYKQIELVGAVAPNATIYYYTSATTDYDSGIYFALLRAVEDNQVQVLLNGFQECETAIGDSAMEMLNGLAEQAAAQGITFVAAAGNSGAAGCAVPGTSGNAAGATYAVNGYASSPYVTAVGGTDFYYGTTAMSTYWNTTNTSTYGSAKTYIPEQVWNDSYGPGGSGTSYSATTTPSVQLAGGGGPSTAGLDGTSTPQTMPSYQLSNANAKSLGNSIARVIPDVSFFAGSGANNSQGYNNTAYMFCMKSSDCISGGTVQFTYSGGTEASSAVFAGAVALAVEQYNSGSRFGLGNVNPTLYSIFSSIVSHDITRGTNELACSSGAACAGGHMSKYAAGTGYDAATGLGSFNVLSFITNYKPTNTTASTVTLAVTKQDGTAIPTCTVNGATSHCITHSTWLKFAVATTPAAATGDVAIFTSSPLASQNAVETLTLSGGTASDTWNLLPGGTYNIYARYAGDTKYASSVTATPYNITVTPENCQMVLYGHNINTGSNTNIPYGTPVYITVEPYSAATTTNVSIPSGSIQVWDSINGAAATQTTTLPINSEGATTFSSNLLTKAQHSITLKYPGDASFNACQAGPFLANVTTANTTTTLNPANPNLNSGSITLTATVAASQIVVNGTTYPTNGTPPTGTVTFKSGSGTTLGSGTLVSGFDINGNAIGAASITLTSIPAGGTVTALYSGDTYYNSSSASTSVSSSSSDIDINGVTTTSFTITDTAGTTGTTYPALDSLTLSISVPNTTAYFLGFIPVTLPSSDGTVSVLANGITIASGIALDGNGNATYTLPQQNGYLTLPTGSVQLSVVYSGWTVSGSFFGFPVNWVTDGASSATKNITISDDRTNADFSLQSDTTVNQSAPLKSPTTTATYNLRLTSLYNFQSAYSNTAITLKCSVIGFSVAGVRSTPAGLTCGFGSLGTTSTTVKIGTTGFTTQAMIVGAASGYAVASNTAPVQPATRWWVAAGGGTTLACIFLFGLPGRRRKWQSMLAVCVLAIAGFGISGCGVTAAAGPQQQGYESLNGGGTGQATTTSVPNGTYTVMVTATVSANTTITHTLPVQVLVGTTN